MTDPKVVAEMERIAAAGGGVLVADRVVESARNPSSPMHGFFTWDDTEAAAKWRLEQARTLIRSVRIVHRTETRVVKAIAYVRDPSAEHGDAGYVAVADIRSREDEARAALVGEFVRIGGLLRRARELAVVLDMEGELDALSGHLEAVRGKLAPADMGPAQARA